LPEVFNHSIKTLFALLHVIFKFLAEKTI